MAGPLADGTELPAKVVIKDKDLNLALVAPVAKPAQPLVALDPNESVIVYRGFRDFVGPYVAHCHNLAHEDHAMMFGWEIT